MISYPICEQHKDCPYQYLVLKKNYQNIRLACSNCIYEDFNNKDYLPLNILQNDPNQMILNASIDDDDLMHYYKNFIQICQTDLSEIKAWKSQLQQVKQIIGTFIDDIDNQIIEIFNYQTKLKTIQQEFFVNFRLEEFYTLLNKMCEEQKVNASKDYTIQLKNLLDSLLGYDNRFIKENIRLLRNQHSLLRICLQETKSVKLLHEINTIVKKYSDSLSVVYSKFNSPCITENKPSSKILSADYFQILIREIEKKSQTKVRFEHELFKGNDFTSQTFWQYVEGKSNILLIVKSKNSIFGGFTPCEWSGQGAKSDEQLISFLFSFNNKRMYHLKRESKDSAIICDKRFGPIFGSFYFDLMIKNGQNGSSYLGHCYGDDGYKGLPSQVLFGGQQLNIVEFEIYEIVY